MSNDKIRGVNLGNWLVLEKWMSPEVFEGTEAEDEIWLNRDLGPEECARRMREHRDSFLGAEDFEYIAAHGFTMVRIPVPFFVFGDRPPYIGCIEYLDKAFDWAESYGVRILVDLHTVPGSQNGYDNGGITGVCKWCKNPAEVEFALTVLERLAQRYGTREGLFGIEVINEPISWMVYTTAPSTGKARDKKEAEGSGYVPMSFLKPFYIEAYRRIRAYMPEEKTIVFHDGFRLKKWKNFFNDNGMKNVMLDTHIYLYAMELFCPVSHPLIHKIYIGLEQRKIAKESCYTPVIVGEWCVSNNYSHRPGKATYNAAYAAYTAWKEQQVNSGQQMPDEAGTPEGVSAASAQQAGQAPAADGKWIHFSKEEAAQQKERFLAAYELQTTAWEQSAGWFYWNYQMMRDRNKPLDEEWKESWDFCRCLEHGWIPNLKEY